MGRTSEFRTDENGRTVLKASYIMKHDPRANSLLKNLPKPRRSRCLTGFSVCV
jgi:hypothetical protein